MADREIIDAAATDVVTKEDEAEAGEAPAEDGQTVHRKKRRRRRKKLKRRLKIAGIVLGALLLICGGFVLAAYGLMKAGESSLKQPAQDVQIMEDAVSEDKGRTVEYQGHSYRLNEDLVSIVFIGYDRGDAPGGSATAAGQADTVMVVALDTEAGKATAINVPCDSMVDVGEIAGDAYSGQDAIQLRLAFDGSDNVEAGSENVTAAVSGIVCNIPMEKYIALNVAGIGPLNDAVGGVALTPIQSIPETVITEGEPTVLYGNNAESYVRWRDASGLDSSPERQQRQVQYVEEFAKTAISNARGNVGAFNDLFKLAREYSVTNLGLGEFSYLASEMLLHGISSMEVVTLPGETVEGPEFVECYLDQDAVYQTVLDVYYERVD